MPLHLLPFLAIRDAHEPPLQPDIQNLPISLELPGRLNEQWVAASRNPLFSVGKDLLHLCLGFSSCPVQLFQEPGDLIRCTLDDG
jgi:hypothetical protein